MTYGIGPDGRSKSSLVLESPLQALSAPLTAVEGEARGRLQALEPESVARLNRFDRTRWGRHRYAAPEDEPPPLPHATDPSRLLERLERLYARGSARSTLARILLRGLAVGYGTSDLNNEERRLGVHHLSPIIRRFERAHEFARTQLGLGPELLELEPLRAQRPTFRRLGKRAVSPPLEVRSGFLSRVAVLWALHKTYLDLKAEAIALTGAPDDESFQGLRRPEGTQKEAFKAHLWLELADLLFLGLQESLLRLTLPELHQTMLDAAGEGDGLASLVEYSVLSRVTGEGRAWQRIRALVEGLVEDAAAKQFFLLSDQVFACVEGGFRTAADLSSGLWMGLEETHSALRARWQVRPVASIQTLEWLARTGRQNQLLLAETWLEDVFQRRQERRLATGSMIGKAGAGSKLASRVAGASAWGASSEAAPWAWLVEAQQQLLQALESPGANASEMQAYAQQLTILAADLRELLEFAADFALMQPEFLHWPGDGEDYRTRRQRATAPADRYAYLAAMGERLLLGLELSWLKAEALTGETRESGRVVPVPGEVLKLIETHEACLFVEEWVAHFGPRLDTIFGLSDRSWQLPGNQRISAVDRRVRDLLTLAREQGAEPERWAWLFCGVTDRLRELLRREGNDGAVASDVEVLLLQGRIEEAEARILTAAAPEALPEDFDAYVTVGVHIFNADTRIVRENLIHNRQLFWPEERLWLLVGSSSANRAIAERERAICLETGVTHRFIAARRHQKAGNQNRVMPNVPAHPHGKTFYLTLDDDYLTGSQTLTRLVAVAERHPTAAFVQLPLYLFGNHLLGISRARLADASSMVVWGSLTSLGLRDLRIFPDSFANRRSLALPFGTCTLFRLTPECNSLDGTGGMFTDTVCEDFAQGLLAFSLKHVHHPRPPMARWDDGILLNEIWIEGDGVELFGRIRQQTRWCEGSVRNGWTIWIPAALHHLRQRFGLEPLPDSRPPSIAQLFGGTVMVLGYGLELAGMVLFMVGFPLTSIIAEYSNTLGHTLKFWMGLWGLHLAYSYYLAMHCGLSLKTFLDQHFIRFASVTGLLEGMYRSLRSPTNTWSACKDARAQINVQLGAVYLGVALINVLGALIGAWKGMTIYYLCLITSVTALWQFQLREAAPIGILDRVRQLPRQLRTPRLAWWAFQREGRREEHARDLSQPIPGVRPITFVLMGLTILAMSARYWELLPKMPGLSHHHPLFLAWLLSADCAQVLSTSWVWLFILCGVRNQPLFQYSALMAAGRKQEPADYDVEAARARAKKLKPVGQLITYLGGWREKATRRGFLSTSGAWVGIAGLAAALRLPHLDMNSAFMDESYYIDAGRRFLTEGVNIGIARVMFGSYLYPVMTALASYLGGLEGSRLLSQLSGVVTAVAVGQVAQRLGGHGVAIVAGVAAAAAYQAVYISSLATYDAVSVAGIAVAMALFATALWGRGAESLSENTRLKYLAGAGGALLFGILSKYVGVVFAPGMAVGVAFFSMREPAVQASKAVLWQRLAAFCAPLVVGMGLYLGTQFDILMAWWAFSKEYTTLITSDARTLIEIYLVKGWNILLALGLAVFGWKASLPQATPTPALRENAFWIKVFLAAQIGMFFVFHGVTRADVNYLKHVNYTFPFLMPLAALGLWRGTDVIRPWLTGHGLPRFAARWLSMVALCIPLLLLGLREVDVLKGALHWWPDLRPYAAALETGVRTDDRILVDDTGLIYYTLDQKINVDSPFYAAYEGLTGVEAVKKGIEKRAYDVVVLDGGITPEGRALHDAVAPLLYPAGYRRLFVSPESPDMAGFYVAPHALERFSRANEVGEAWMKAWYKENKKAE